jgi:PAS domain S-box-containing protein
MADPRPGEEALREFGMLREIFENIGYVFWLRDLKEERILYVSPAFERIWGRSVESLFESPRTWVDSIHPDDRAEVLSAALVDARLNQDAKQYRILRPDGTVRRIEDRAYPVRNALGEVYRLAGVARDVTDCLSDRPSGPDSPK